MAQNGKVLAVTLAQRAGENPLREPALVEDYAGVKREIPVGRNDLLFVIPLRLPSPTPPCSPTLLPRSWSLLVPAVDPRRLATPTPVPPTATPSPMVRYSTRMEADRWGVCGDMRADYELPIDVPGGYRWDGDTDRVRQLTKLESGRGPDNVSWSIVGVSLAGPQVLNVKLHVGAKCWIGGPKISIQAGARFVR